MTLAHLYGVMLGGGVLVAYFGIRRITSAEKADRDRRIGLLMVNLGVLVIAGSLALTLWGK